jgi:putative aldouronate transport system substrate-binding protein
MLLVLSSCGTPAGSSAPADTSAPTENAVPADTSASTEDAASADALDTSEKVTVIMYGFGTSSPRDFYDVAGALSKKTEEDLNCVLDFNLFNDADTIQRMMLMLSSGQPIDLVASASWCNYADYANKGAYVALEDLLPKYAPDLWEYVSEDSWNGVKVNGHIYMVPSMAQSYPTYGFLYREDLRKKYNLPEIKDFNTIEQYMQAIKDNEPDMQVSGEMVNTYDPIGPHFSNWEMLDMEYPWMDQAMPYGLYTEYKDPTTVTNFWASDEFRTDMKRFKSWADAGFWSKSSLAKTASKSDEFLAGKIACDLSVHSPNNVASYSSTLKTIHPDWEVGWLPYGSVKKMVTPSYPTENGFCIPSTSENTERALMVLEKLVLDKEYNHLTQYGIEGVHYTETEDGFYQSVGDEVNSGFPREGANLWALRNPEFMLYPPESGQIVQDLNDMFAEYTYPNFFDGFSEDSSNYQAERAAVTNVQAQYLPAIQAGLVEDVDVAIDEFNEKLKVAGIEKVHEEYIAQWLQYVKDMNIKPIS